MKRLFFLFCFAATLSAQVNFTITGAIPNAQFVSFEAVRVQTFVPATSTPLPTITGSLTSGATSITVSATPAGWATGLLSARPATCTQQDAANFPLNLYFATDNSTIYTCVANNVWGVFGSQIRIDSEAIDVTAFSGTTWTIARGKGQTTAAAHSSGAKVNFLLYPTAQLWAKQFIRAGLASVLQNDAAVQAQQAVIAADQVALANLQNASVQ